MRADQKSSTGLGEKASIAEQLMNEAAKFALEVEDQFFFYADMNASAIDESSEGLTMGMPEIEASPKPSAPNFMSQELPSLQGKADHADPVLEPEEPELFLT